jgi:hypothetical protein
MNSYRPLTSDKKLGAPQIQDDSTAFANPVSQSSEHLSICRWIEVAKTLRHDHRNVEPAGIRPVIANIRVHVGWAASQGASFCDYISVAINADH